MYKDLVIIIIIRAYLAAVFLTTSGMTELHFLTLPWGCIPLARLQSSQFHTRGLFSGRGCRQVKCTP